MNTQFTKLYNRYRPGLVLAIVLITFCLLLLVPIKIPYTITLPGKILCRNEFLVSTTSNGQIIATKIDRVKGMLNNYSVHQFDRDDIVSFTLRDGLSQGTFVRAGDTIGFIHSTELDYTTEHLQGEISQSDALLKRALTGEKESVVEGLKKSVEFAVTQYQQYEKEYNRAKLMLEKNIISQQEFEIIERKMKAASIAIDIEKAKLRTVTTGAQEEELSILRSRLAAQTKELQLLKNKSSRFSLITPVSGTLLQYGNKDTLLSILESSSFVVFMPLAIQERSFVREKQTVNMATYDNNKLPDASIHNIEKGIVTIHGNQVFLTSAQLFSKNRDIHGLSTICNIQCDSITPLEYLLRKLHNHLNS